MISVFDHPWRGGLFADQEARSACDIPIYEVHLSNVHQRETFRHHSYMSGVATGVIAGLGAAGYRAALERLLV